MQNFVIVTDSCCDLPPELAEALQLHVIPLSYEMKGVTYHNDLAWSEITPEAFYRFLKEEEPAKTSALSVGAYTDYLEPLLQAGQDVLILAFSSGLSSTFNASAIAMGELKEKYPERTICTVDTLCASLGQGLLVYLAAMRRAAGMDLEAVRTYAEETKLHVCHWFTVSDLNFLKRGGRISGATALLGSMLGIKPVLHVDDEGHLISVAKARGRGASLTALIENMAKTVVAPETQTVFISHCNCPEDAEKLRNMVLTRFPVKEVLIHHIGPVIGSHSGPGTLALFFLGTKR